MALLSDALVEKAKAVKSAQELFDLAKENDMDISMDEAEMYYEMIRMSANA